MNSLDDLRGTLEQHAAELHDSERYVRPVAVRERIRAARRRRASAVAVAAAVVLVGGVASVGALTGPAPVAPAGPSVVGVDVPEAVEIHGFPYELAGTEPLEGEDDRLRLGRSDATRAVSLVADGLGAGTATLYADGVAIARALGDDAVELPVPTGGAGSLKVELDWAPASARVGVAVYEATDELAPGVSNGVAVFRERVADAELVAAAFSEEGESEVAVSYDGDFEGMRVTSWCRTEERGLWFHTEIAGVSEAVGRCAGEVGRDAGAGGAYTPGGDHPEDSEVRTYLTRGQLGPVVEEAEAQLGVGVYRSGETVRVAGTTVSGVVEHGGRRWQLDQTTPFGRLKRFSTGIQAPDSDLLLGLVAQGRMARVTWSGLTTEGGSAYINAPQGPASITGGLLLEDDGYVVEVTGQGWLARGALLVYRPVDVPGQG